MDSLYFAIPIRRALGNEEVRNVLLFAPGVEISTELAAIVGLNRGNRKTKLFFRELDSFCRTGAFSGRIYLKKVLLRIGIKNRELIAPRSSLVYVFYVQLNAFSRFSDDERRSKGSKIAEFSLAFPEQSFSPIETVDDGGRHGQIEHSFELKLHFERSIVGFPFPRCHPGPDLLSEFYFAVRPSWPVVVRAITMIAIPPFVVCFPRYIENSAGFSNRLFLAFCLAVPKQTNIFWVVHTPSEHCHLSHCPVSPCGVNCTFTMIISQL